MASDSGARDGEDVLVTYMHEWLRYFGDPDFPGQTITARITLQACMSRAAVVAHNVEMLLYTLDAAGCASVRDALIAVRLAVGTWSGAAAMYTMRVHRHRLAGVVRGVADLAASMKGVTDHQCAVDMERVVRRARRVWSFFTWYSVAMQLGTWFTIVITTEQHWAEVAARGLLAALGRGAAGTAVMDGRADEGEPGAAVRWLYRANTLLRCQVSFSVVYALVVFILPYTIIVYGALAALQVQIGRLLETRHCQPRWGAMQRAVLQAGMLATEAMEGPIPHLLVAAFVLPLLSTVDLVMNGSEADGFALVIAPVIVLVFFPVCEAGDWLTAARQDLAERAYGGPWLEESARASHMRLCMMLPSRGRGAQLKGFGVGVLHRGAFSSSMRGWFNFLQAVINLRRAAVKS